MYSEYNAEVKAKGTKEELVAMIEVTYDYQDEYYESDRIKEINSIKATDEGKFYLEMYCCGMYAEYGHPDDTGLFQSLANSAPYASFDGVLEGYDDYMGSITVNAKLKEGKLTLKVKYSINNPDEFKTTAEPDEDGWYSYTETYQFNPETGKYEGIKMK